MSILEKEDFHSKTECFDLYKKGTFGYFKEYILKNRELFATPKSKGTSNNSKAEYEEDDGVATEDNIKPEFNEGQLHSYSTSSKMQRRKGIYERMTDMLSHFDFVESYALGKTYITLKSLEVKLDLDKNEHRDTNCDTVFPITHDEDNQYLSNKLYNYTKLRFQNNIEKLTNEIKELNDSNIHHEVIEELLEHIGGIAQHFNPVRKAIGFGER